MNEVFGLLRSDLGPVPGKSVITSTQILFSKLLYPKLQAYLKAKGLQYQIKSSPRDCYGTAICQNYLKKAMSFRAATKAIYPVINATEQFLTQRPDFYLGRFLSMFSGNLSISYNPCLLFEGLKAQIANLVSEQLMGFTANLLGCSGTLDRVMSSDFETFVDIVKYSQVQIPLNLSQDFEPKFINSSVFPLSAPTERPRFLPDPIGMIPF